VTGAVVRDDLGAKREERGEKERREEEERKKRGGRKGEERVKKGFALVNTAHQLHKIVWCD
jgi:hypothetical protein